MANWVRLNDKDNIVEYLDELPKNYANVSNFQRYEYPQQYGFYRYVEVHPPYNDRIYKKGNPIKTIDKEQGKVIVTFSLIPLSDNIRVW